MSRLMMLPLTAEGLPHYGGSLVLRIPLGPVALRTSTDTHSRTVRNLAPVRIVPVPPRQRGRHALRATWWHRVAHEMGRAWVWNR